MKPIHPVAARYQQVLLHRHCAQSLRQRLCFAASELSSLPLHVLGCCGARGRGFACKDIGIRLMHVAGRVVGHCRVRPSIDAQQADPGWPRMERQGV